MTKYHWIALAVMAGVVLYYRRKPAPDRQPVPDVFQDAFEYVLAP